MSKGSYSHFIDALGARESGNRYDSVNTFNFMGRWQFGKQRLYDLGYSINGWHPEGQPMKENITMEYFLNTPAVQDIAMYRHVQDLKKRITKKYSEHFGKTVNGIQVTLSGCIAAAHLKGLGGLSKLLQGKDNADAFGTKASTYLEQFGDYDLEEIA